VPYSYGSCYRRSRTIASGLTKGGPNSHPIHFLCKQPILPLSVCWHSAHPVYGLTKSDVRICESRMAESLLVKELSEVTSVKNANCVDSNRRDEQGP
jgi:hypothetical protein